MKYEPIEPQESVSRYDSVVIATQASWVVNWFLFFVKLYVFVFSYSKAVAAALVDSAVDLISQAVLSTTESSVQIHHSNYPIGRSRLEALGVLCCAAVMIMASIEVVQFSFMELIDGVFRGAIPELHYGVIMFAILGVGTGLKVILFIYCRHVNSKNNLSSDTLDALAEDHLNDVMSNTMAILTAYISIQYPLRWWIDPVGAIAISAVIIYRWHDVIMDQVKKIVGHTAPDEFINSMNELAENHDPRITVDVTRAYHFGAAFNVEMEIVLPAEMTVRESHDIALALQHRIEEYDVVERAFVHVDYQKRDGLEHKVERHLYLRHRSMSDEGGSVDSVTGEPKHRLGKDAQCSDHGLCTNPYHIPEGVYGSV
mmetsp:Transcript_25344/g.37371  ORF Transcript_25344/g.37371 Transcript_25344/m.37371 type:complete len:370 (+) Transcript_25344:105-1214(+)|eukprot:CAMPEP_0185018562 /NCGR_PEP_ID=MMETSP1103-20130426/1240_1 /TAXON_ID=36769 /ORGANISM="Paraphysomonas bandaiensis, Strain Caron Lab Isolate" /LENGTH=369 /DNA_ID=CAMNT_0027548407 /DNA_START=97 /DNA_END=1206 /DNA_ORIENTATION=-